MNKLYRKKCAVKGCNTITWSGTGYCCGHGHLIDRHYNHVPSREEFLARVGNPHLQEDISGQIPYGVSLFTRVI